MDQLKNRVTDNDQFAKHAGLELVAVSPGYAQVKMTITDYHLNGVGTVHGGALFTLADFAFAVAANSHDSVAVGINANIAYFKASKTGTLFAEAKEVSLRARLGNYTVHITDDQGELVAIFQGTAYRKKAENQPSTD